MKSCKGSGGALQDVVYSCTDCSPSNLSAKVWAHGAHHPDHKFRAQPFCLGAGSGGKSLPGCADALQAQLSPGAREETSQTLRSEANSCSLINSPDVLSEEESNWFLFGILQEEKWYFTVLVTLRSLALKLGHIFCHDDTLIQVINIKALLGHSNS